MRKGFVKLILIWSILLLPFRILAQSYSNDRLISIGLSYYGDIELADPASLEPGLLIDLNFPIVSNAKNNPKHYRQLSFKPSLGFYQRKDYHTGMLIWTQIGYKAVRRSGFLWELNAGPGYLHTFYNAPVYFQNDDGSFSEKKVVGDAHAILGGELMIGWDFYRNVGVPVEIFVSGGFYGRYPHNTNWARHKFLKIGAAFVLGKS
ncbi:MAG: hypothetical protein GY751_25340 [Bacteroidetes bacterium]|nr:hypothetical protein [Bacteroidota bacterium]